MDFLYVVYAYACLLGLAVGGAGAASVSYAVPASMPGSAVVLDPAPVGVSIEFFTFPAYMKNVTATNQCLLNFQTLTGTWPPIRIGGTTQDRAEYDASSSAYVTYSVASSTSAPTSLTFGPSFMTLAGTYKGTVVLGLNRGHNNIDNTIAAAKVAKSSMSNLLAIELGNEPEYWGGGAQPIAANGWGPSQDAASENSWAVSVGSAISTKPIIQGCNSLSNPPSWGAAELIAAASSDALSYVKTYSHHSYPGGSVTSLMSHTNIASGVDGFSTDRKAATAAGKEYVFGELNSITGGGAASVSPTFGAALWTMDYSLRAALNLIKRSYYHHGTLGACYYCWWGRYTIASPYYGAYAAVAAMAGGSHISALDPGTTNYAAYAIYANNKPIRVLLYNSDYYGGSGTRGSMNFILTGLTGSTVRAKRLTAVSSLSRQDQGEHPTFGGQYFQDQTCNIQGTETFENTAVSAGQVTLTLAASEALLVYL